MANAEKDLHTDIAIVGGGLTGGLAALALARRGFSIALIERSPKEALLASHFDGRTTACLLYTSPSPRDLSTSRMPSSA